MLSERPTVSLESEHHLCISQLQLFQSIVFAWRSLANLCAMAPKGVKKTGLKEQMDPKEVSKMLGYLKYQASPKSKGDSEAKSKAAIALSTYQKLAPDQKAGFFEKVRVESTRSELGWRDCRRGKQFNPNQNKLR